MMFALSYNSVIIIAQRQEKGEIKLPFTIRENDHETQLYTAKEAAKQTGYTEDYVRNSMYGNLERGVDLTDHRYQLGSSSYLTAAGLEKLEEWKRERGRKS